MLEQTQTSTWQSKLKALGPGILMASAAVGGSHIVSSAQAGAKYGWALMGLVILANLFKYPFFRFGAEYTLETGHSLVEGYAQKRKSLLRHLLRFKCLLRLGQYSRGWNSLCCYHRQRLSKRPWTQHYSMVSDPYHPDLGNATLWWLQVPRWPCQMDHVRSNLCNRYCGHRCHYQAS